TAAPSPGVPSARFFGRPVFEDRLATESHFAGRIDVRHHDHQFIADLYFVFDALNAMIGKLTDVYEAIFAGQKLYERTIRLNARHLAGIDTPDLGLFGHAEDGLSSAIRAWSVGSRDEDGAVFLDVDGDLILVLQAADGLSTRADNAANLLRIDFERLHAWGIGAQ